MLESASVFYRRLIRPLLYLLPAEAAHHLAFACLRWCTAIPGVRLLMRAIFLRSRSSLTVDALGQRFPSPVGLAAGFDKDAIGFEALGAMGFGFVEVGTLTALPQPGNRKPRLFRLPADRALVNRMGFNNRGSEDAVRRLKKPRRTIVGVNIGKSRVTPEEHAVADYVASATRVAPFADYVVVNVSSPNTPGLRDLQAVDKLRPLLVAVRDALNAASPGRRVPLLVKIAPDMTDAAVQGVADLAVELQLEGIIAVNTTTSREGLASGVSEVDAAGAGGLSGVPLRRRALEVLEHLRARVGEHMVLISVGGIENADQAWERILAGATLVQVYTAFVYEGPLLPSRLNRRLARKAKETGLVSVSEAVGFRADSSRPPRSHFTTRAGLG